MRARKPFLRFLFGDARDAGSSPRKNYATMRLLFLSFFFLYRSPRVIKERANFRATGDAVEYCEISHARASVCVGYCLIMCRERR